MIEADADDEGKRGHMELVVLGYAGGAGRVVS